MHWTAWAWWVQDCTFPSLISDWNGTPLGSVGLAVQAALKAGPTSTSASAATTATTAKVTTSTSTTAKAATSTSTTAKTSTSTSSSSTTGSSTTSGPVVITTNSGDNINWFGINSITGSIWTTLGSQTVWMKDSSSSAQWVEGAYQSWGGWTWAQSTSYVLPLSIRLTTIATPAKSATLTNVITAFPAASYTATATYA